MKLITIYIVFFAIVCECFVSSRRTPNVFHIGGVLSNNDSVYHFGRTIQVLASDDIMILFI